METLTGATVEAVLARLGVDGVEPDRVGLDAVYLAWCHHVPFDNLVKRVDLVAQASRFRNDEPEAFFALWLAHGCGGTCWPSSRALGALLHTLGFEVRLGSAAMMDEIVGPIHSHGTVLARVGGEVLWVDSSMLTDAPVLLVAGEHTALEHPVRPVRVEPVDDRWRVRWRSGGLDMELGCLLLADDVDGAHYSARYEWSRENSPFQRGRVRNGQPARSGAQLRDGAAGGARRERLHDRRPANRAGATRSTRRRVRLLGGARRRATARRPPARRPPARRPPAVTRGPVQTTTSPSVSS
ncbi:MAG: hypothetical protein SGJ13_15305 [Actinomycetota bacterium]|nr:hypothetical protein [Actinomycetota bacterium]